MIDKELIGKFKMYCDSYGWSFDSETTECTFQFRFGWFINFYFPDKYVVDFEINTRKFRKIKEHKSEIDIYLLDKLKLTHTAIEVKYIKDPSGYDITLFEMCKDIKFLETLISLEEFEKCFSLVFCSIANAYTPPRNGKYRTFGPRLDFYKNFREHHIIKGLMYRDETKQYLFDKEYKLEWFDFTDSIKVCIVEVHKSEK